VPGLGPQREAAIASASAATPESTKARGPSEAGVMREDDEEAAEQSAHLLRPTSGDRPPPRA